MTDLKDNVRQGESVAPKLAPEQQRQADNYFGSKGSVPVITAPGEKRHIGEAELKDIFAFAQENGLGADRSQGRGKFVVTAFNVVHQGKPRAAAPDEKPAKPAKPRGPKVPVTDLALD